MVVADGETASIDREAVESIGVVVERAPKAAAIDGRSLIEDCTSGSIKAPRVHGVDVRAGARRLSYRQTQFSLAAFYAKALGKKNDGL